MKNKELSESSANIALILKEIMIFLSTECCNNPNILNNIQSVIQQNNKAAENWSIKDFIKLLKVVYKSESNIKNIPYDIKNEIIPPIVQLLNFINNKPVNKEDLQRAIIELSIMISELIKISPEIGYDRIQILNHELNRFANDNPYNWSNSLLSILGTSKVIKIISDKEIWQAAENNSFKDLVSFIDNLSKESNLNAYISNKTLNLIAQREWELASIEIVGNFFRNKKALLELCKETLGEESVDLLLNGKIKEAFKQISWISLIGNLPKLLKKLDETIDPEYKPLYNFIKSNHSMIYHLLIKYDMIPQSIVSLINSGLATLIKPSSYVIPYIGWGIGKAASTISYLVGGIKKIDDFSSSITSISNTFSENGPIVSDISYDFYNTARNKKNIQEKTNNYLINFLESFDKKTDSIINIDKILKNNFFYPNYLRRILSGRKIFNQYEDIFTSWIQDENSELPKELNLEDPRRIMMEKLFYHDFSNIVLDNTKWNSLNLKDFNFSSMTIHGKCSIENSNLIGCNFQGISLKNDSMLDLSGSIIDNNVLMSLLPFIKNNLVSLDNVVFQGNFYDLDLENIQLNNVDLSNANLINCNVKNMKLRNAKFNINTFLKSKNYDNVSNNDAKISYIIDKIKDNELEEAIDTISFNVIDDIITKYQSELNLELEDKEIKNIFKYLMKNIYPELKKDIKEYYNNFPADPNLLTNTASINLRKGLVESIYYIIHNNIEYIAKESLEKENLSHNFFNAIKEAIFSLLRPLYEIKLRKEDRTISKIKNSIEDKLQENIQYSKNTTNVYANSAGIKNQVSIHDKKLLICRIVDNLSLEEKSMAFIKTQKQYKMITGILEEVMSEYVLDNKSLQSIENNLERNLRLELSKINSNEYDEKLIKLLCKYSINKSLLSFTPAIIR